MLPLYILGKDLLEEDNTKEIFDFTNTYNINTNVDSLVHVHISPVIRKLIPGMLLWYIWNTSQENEMLIYQSFLLEHPHPRKNVWNIIYPCAVLTANCIQITLSTHMWNDNKNAI